MRRARTRIGCGAAFSSGIAAALIVAGVISGPAGAGTRARGAGKPVLEYVTPSLGPNITGALDVDALGARACQLSFAVSGHRRLGPFAITLRHRHVQWTWRVPASVEPGRWTAQVACANSRIALRRGRSAKLTETLTVRGRQAGSHTGILAVRSLRVHTSNAAPAGRVGAGGGDVIGVGGSGNPFPAGQCTYHAYETRPDIYDFAVAHGVPHRGYASGALFGGIPDYWWNAWRWLSDAQGAGIPTGTTPVPGALAVFPRGYYGSAVGHVAYVVSVNPNGSFLVSERNWNHHPYVTERLAYPYPGEGFIYGGPAGNGPAPPPTTTSTTTTTSTATTTTGTTTTTTTTPPAPKFYVHHVQGTCPDGACGLHERTGPGYSNYASVGVLSDGQEIDIVCQTKGQLVTPNRGTPSDVWDRLTNGSYVTDVYTDTPGVGGAFSPPIPQC